MTEDQRQTLYRFFAADGTLLYIGITESLPARLHKHDRRKPWFFEVSSVTLEHYPNRAEVLIAENKAIKEERPKYNVQHNDPSARRGIWPPGDDHLSRIIREMDQAGLPTNLSQRASKNWLLDHGLHIQGKTITWRAAWAARRAR